ncbi:MAG TPA: hypothetical protein VKU19_25365 [Bryobacteraceae bacterium]|nr:hypothetical protein [Bryobacteraceae bacterium]
MLKRLIFWDYPRGSRGYDLIVGIILAFIFLTPREWFRDQPRIPKASSIAMLPTEKGSSPFFVDAELLKNTPEAQRVVKLTELLQKRTGNRHLEVIRVEPILDSEGELQGYMAFARL